MIKCSACDKEFLDRRGFTAHMRIKHSQDTEKLEIATQNVKVDDISKDVNKSNSFSKNKGSNGWLILGIMGTLLGVLFGLRR